MIELAPNRKQGLALANPLMAAPGAVPEQDGRAQANQAPAPAAVLEEQRVEPVESRTLRVTEETFIEDVAPARTFGFLEDVEMMRQQGLALDGCIVEGTLIDQ